MRRAPRVRGDVVAPGGVAVDVDAARRVMAGPRRTRQEQKDGGNESCRVACRSGREVSRIMYSKAEGRCQAVISST